MSPIAILLPLVFSMLPARPAGAGEAPVLGTPAPVLSRGRVPAAGSSTVDVEIAQVGRYSFAVRGPRGAGLQLVDRATGPGPVVAAGRIDRILDRGRYRLVVHGPADATGELEVEGRGSTERAADGPRVLVEPRTVEASLGDREQHSWWLPVDEARTFWLEAAGRNLADLRLWESGAWLLDAEPELDTVEPVKGRPLRRARLAVKLEPGLYLVTAYGGPGPAWAEGGDGSPLWLRTGMPRLPEAGRRRYAVSPFGVDRYRLPGKADYARLELPEPRRAALAVGGLDPARPFGGGGNRAEILKTSLDPVAELHFEAQGDDRVLTVEGSAGQPYVLQHFARSGSVDASKGGRYWVASMHAGDPRDSIDASGLLVARRWTAKGWESSLVAAKALELGPKEVFARRANLDGPLSLILHTEEAGVWQVLLGGLEAKCRVEPFLLARPAGYKEPPFLGSGSFFALDPGYHELTVAADAPGILDLGIRPAGAVDQVWKPHTGKGPGAAAVTLDVDRPLTIAVEIPRKGRYVLKTRGGEVLHRIDPFRAAPAKGNLDALGFEESGTPWALGPGSHVLTLKPTRPGRVEVALVDEAGTLTWDPSAPGTGAAARPRRGAVRFAPARLEKGFEHSLYMGRQPGVAQGVICRPLPVDLAEPLFVSQAPGETVTVEVRAAAAGRLEAVAEDGTRIPVSVDGASPALDPSLAEGPHVLRITWAGEEPLGYTLALASRRTDPREPLAPLPAARLAGLPDFPVLGPGAPRPFEIERRARTTFRVAVAEAGSYALESTGLLALGARLRTRTLPALASVAENGPGRNFLVERVLGSGDYLLSIDARGYSKGHAVARLRPTPTVEGGEVHPGRGARRTTGAGEGVAWTLLVAEAGSYRIGVETLGRTLPVSIEDAEGWPLVEPGTRWIRTLTLAPGRYRVWSGPEPARTRRVLTFEAVGRAPVRRGQGPHRLALDEAVEHEWVGEDGVPDGWEFSLPAPNTVFVALDGAVKGRVLRAGGETVTQLVGGRWWGARLEPGSYRIEVLPGRRDNRVPYRLKLLADRMVEGMTRAVLAPARIPLAVGRVGVLELASRGLADVRARLLAEDGRELAREDDRPDDWNFALRCLVEPGRYTLVVEPAGRGRAEASVRMALAAETALPALALPGAVELPSAADTRTMALATGGAGGMLVLEVEAAENVAVAVEPAADPAGASARAQGRRIRLELPWTRELGDPTLKLTTLDGQGGTARVAARMAPVEEVDEAGLAGAGLAGVAAGRGYRRIRLARPGLLRFAPAEGLAVGTRPGRALAPPGLDGLVGSLGTALWIGAAAAPVRAQRVVLAPGTRLAHRLGAGDAVAVDLAPGTGPVAAWVRAAAGNPGLVLGPAPAGTMGAEAGVAFDVSDAAGAARLVVFDAGRDGRDLPVEVGLTRLGAPAVRTAAGRLEAGAVEAGAATLVELPGAERELRIGLGRGLLARLEAPDGVRILGAPGRAIVEVVAVAGPARLLLAGIGPGASPYRIEEVGPGPAHARGGDGAAHGVVAATGRIRVPVPAPRDGPGRLQLEGAVRAAVFVGDSGRVASGVGSLDHDEAGEVRLELEPGAWSVRARGAPAGDPGAGAPVEAGTGGSFPLVGAGRTFALRGPGPCVMLATLTHAASLRVEGEGREPAQAFLPRGGSRTFLLPRGRGALTVEPLGSEALAGRLTVTLDEPEPLAEGRGAPALVPPGGVKSYRLGLEGPARLGLGVESDPEGATVRLLGPDGAVLGQGASQLVALQAGVHVLEVRAAAEGPPRRIRPVVVGLTPRDPGPPPGEIERFRELGASRGGER